MPSSTQGPEDRDQCPWPECRSSLVRGLGIYSDQELVTHLQNHPEQGRYFIALFCRFERQVDAQMRTRLPPLSESQRHWIWEQLFLGLSQLQVTDPGTFSLSTWMEQQVNMRMTEVEVSSQDQSERELVSEREQSLAAISPVLHCYVQQALAKLPPDKRFVLVLHDTFRWTEHQILTQLRQEGISLSPQATLEFIQSARQTLFQELPGDIRALYLRTRP